jgi:thiamine biosynthesis protein ThiI
MEPPSFMAYIIRYAEIGLKGKNRVVFENKLIKNIKARLQGSIIIKHFGRFYMYNNQMDDDEIKNRLKTVFGIANFSKAIECEADMEDIKEVVLKFVEEEIKNRNAKTFRVTTNRIEKKLKGSLEMDKELGAFVVEKTGLKVSLKEHDLNIGVEISDKIYLYKEKIEGPGGLPVGTEGNVLGLIEDEDSMVACFLAMKRGCDLFPAIFDEVQKEKVQTFIDKLQFFSPRELKLHIITENNLDEVAEKYNLHAIIVNDRIESIRDEYSITTLRPLIGMAEAEIDEIKSQILVSLSWLFL